MGAARRAPRGPAPAAQRRGPEQEGAAHADRGEDRGRTGPSTGPDAVENLRPYRVPGTRARIGFATSLPAFIYGDPPPASTPAPTRARYYMRCLDKLGTNLVMQDEANPGRWVAEPRVLAAARLDALDLACGGRPHRGLRLQRDSAPGRQPRRPGVRRSDRDHPARPARAAIAAPTSAIALPGEPAGERPAAARALRRAEARVPGAGAVGGAGRAPRRRCAASGAGWRPGSGDRARERLPRNGDRRRPAVPAGSVAARTASRRPAEAGRGRTTSVAARPADARPWPGKRTDSGAVAGNRRRGSHPGRVPHSAQQHAAESLRRRAVHLRRCQSPRPRRCHRSGADGRRGQPAALLHPRRGPPRNSETRLSGFACLRSCWAQPRCR